jgi:lysophospholipase L1-like esterase
MRVLLISDSHGHGLAREMETLEHGLRVMTIRKGRKIPAIRGMYRDKLRSIRRFHPEVVYIHVGHNDLVPHTLLNPRPLFITSILHQVRELVQEVAATLPGVYIVVSSILPRVTGGEFSSEAVGRYNRLAKRFGEMVRSASRGAGAFFLSIVNRIMWGRIARYEPLSGFHKRDGLHLNREGRKRMVRGWMSLLNALRDME